MSHPVTAREAQIRHEESEVLLTQSRSNAVLLLLGLSVLINYIDRSNLSIAAPLLKDELHISATQLGTLLSAFFVPYCCLQIPAGWLADRFDVKWVFAAGFFIWSTATAVTGLLHGFAALLLIRVVLGVGESVAFPSYSKILGSHFHDTRRGFANSIIAAGLALGPAAGMLIGGTAVGRFGWRPFFIALGLLGFLWLAPWIASMPARRAPSPHQVQASSAGILDVLRQRSAWGMCLCQFSINYGLYFLVTWLPFYLVRGRNMSMNQMARVGGLVFLLSAISAISFGKIADRWTSAGASPTRVYKGLLIVGKLGWGLALILTALAPAHLVVWMLAIMGIFNGIVNGNVWAVSQIVAGRRMVGRWTGLQNFVGNFAGWIAPALTGFLLDRTGHFYWPFFIAAAMLWIGALSWIFIVGPVEAVNWDSSRPDVAAIAVRAAPQSPLS